MNINLTRKPDRVKITIDSSTIDYLKPRVGECEIFFVDGETVTVYEEDKVIHRLIREARK